MTVDAVRPLSQTRWREGYSIAEVDAFLADVTPLLAGRLPDAALAQRISDARFTPTRMRLGYDMGDVDDRLEELRTLASQGHRRI
jgi:hypothetical protein|nr:hypothetical protein [Aeromicrobium sp.]